MKTHVDLLGILFILSGVVNLLIGVALVSLAIAAAALFPAGDPEGAGLASALAALLFLVVGVVVLLWGGASFWAGRAIRRLRPSARLAGLVMAVLNLFVLPFGTALGLYSLWVLLNDQARQLFEPVAG